MKFIKTMQLQIVDGKDDIVETTSRYVASMNFISQFARENDIYSKNKIQSLIYQEIRERFGLKSQMTINAIGDVAMQYAGEHKSNRKRKNKDGTPRAVHFKSPSMRLNYPRDYGFKENDTISINTLDGRMIIPYKIGEYQRGMLESGNWQIKSSMLTIRKRDKTIFLNISIEKDVQEHTFLNKDGIVGVDLGMNFVAVTTDSKDKTRFYGGGVVKYDRWLHAKHRKELQGKGTRSATRKLREMSGRETRFVKDTNQCIAKDIVNIALRSFASPIIVMEKLKGIRQQRYIGKTQKVNLNKWAFFQLQQFIEYKAIEHGVPIIYIDPAYTSQDCPKCGHREKGNRNKRLHVFKCKKCGYTSNDDRIGSMNIRDRGVVFRYIRETRGFVNNPIVAGDDAETSSDGLIRNLVTSPRL
jgi:IS605 OrfB family transposase